MSEIIIKNPSEIAFMRTSGQLLAKVFEALDDYIAIGQSTLDINNFVEDFITNTLNARPASKGQYGFKYVLNPSINEVVCHGVPSSTEKLKNGDIINIDITLEKNGFIADSSKMYCIGDVTPLAKRLVDTSYEALWLAIKQVKPGAKLGDIGAVIQQHAEQRGYTVVREYCGHGIGQQMHEAPEVLHFGKKGSGVTLQEGMTFTIEPMINQGTSKTKTLSNGWTVVTRDKKLSAQWEHTILVTKDGFEVLTLRQEEKLQMND
ncbi:type I methionyl aminopeptidase [Pseudoalteromonas sp. G4]|uniref:type I methionyl aminopeptidase n=1 Tax=Pseudoalteromonas sp. G4 TaxID=2992761 RepID=UPI00237DB7D0|nr:type I methionyl aminopeptidase [Pseudoalteromonas sp. G4]MDE3272170.1 type I methionyl aminopeptidase [Pseudoalteromonas sp. G4]